MTKQKFYFLCFAQNQGALNGVLNSYNDYMNCLYGDPTTEKLIPLIDAAAEAGCEYFCIDAGWYADGIWWDEVGEWKPSSVRFPKGIIEPINHILEKGMIPGYGNPLSACGETPG